MNEVLVKENIKIEDMIYEIRGKQVMLDRDLAKLYQVQTKRINEAVNRNKNKFPKRFSWILDNFEIQILWSQNATANINSKSRTNPRVFTEQGIAMLATILKSDIAIQVSINIMDAFISIRKYISNSLLEQKYINELVLKDNKRIDLLEQTFSKFKENANEIYFEEQIYDAYSKIIDIISKAKKELIIIDAYADKSVLDIISKIKCNIILICKTKSSLSKMDIDKYNKQYNNLKIIYNDTFHDRYFILDKNILYHCGTSLNHIGEKTFSINKIEDTIIINKLSEEIKNLYNIVKKNI